MTRRLVRQHDVMLRRHGRPLREGDRRVCIAALESPHGLRTIVATGAALPLDKGSAGKVLRTTDGSTP